MGKLAKIGMFALCCAGSAAHAETLTVSGWYAANNREVAMVRSLAVDRFDGNEGSALASAIERALAKGRDRDGQRYFDIRSGYGQADALVSGAMQVRVENSKFKRKAKRCADDTDSTDCKDAEKIDIELKCTRRIIAATADVKIVRSDDDALIYSRSLPQRNQVEYCEDDDLPPGVDTVVMPFLTTIANEVAGGVTPYGRTEKIRVRETRTGLSKADSAKMKSLIAATKTSGAAACAGWREMKGRGVSHPTLSFNLGLCAESAGELDTAMRYYQGLAASAKPASDVKDGLNRVQRRLDGEADDRARNGL